MKNIIEAEQKVMFAELEMKMALTTRNRKLAEIHLKTANELLQKELNILLNTDLKMEQPIVCQQY